MTQYIIKIPKSVHSSLQKHLIPRRFVNEEAAFMFVQRVLESESVAFQYVDWMPVSSNGFSFQSDCHIELTDEVKARVIKKAHDLQASIVEFHSHTGFWPAEFSPSDLSGFREFVPHVWWRLKGRPYFAVVVSRAGFDGLAWVNDPEISERLTGIMVGNTLFKSNAYKEWNYGKKSF